MSDKQDAPGFLEGIMGIFGRREPEEQNDTPPSSGYAASAEALGDLLTQLADRAQEQRAARRHNQALASGRLSDLDQEEREEIKYERTEEIHARIRGDVLEMHRQLSTGIEDAELTKLDTFMRGMCEVMSAPAAAGIEPYVRATVVRRFFHETGPLAWARLTDCMDRAGVQWPAPDDHQRAHKRAEAEELFVHAAPTVMADLVTGIVAIWKDHYPNAGSLLWQSVCLRAVGAGLRARMLHRSMRHVQAQRDELLRESEVLLRKEIATVQEVLNSGVRSVEEADQVMAGAGGLLEEVIPDLCWDRARAIATKE